jgi:hypothetical protein
MCHNDYTLITPSEKHFLAHFWKIFYPNKKYYLEEEMNHFESWLAEGDLTSDGRADEIAAIVLQNPEELEALIACLDSENPNVRGHAADAMEKIGRQKPELFLPFIHRLLKATEKDPVDMVQWHLAMLLGYMALFKEHIDPILAALIQDLNVGGGYTKSWAMVSLGIIARLFPDRQALILDAVSKFKTSSMPAVRKRAEIVLGTLLEGKSLPEDWVKCPAIQAKLSLR